MTPLALASSYQDSCIVDHSYWLACVINQRSLLLACGTNLNASTGPDWLVPGQLYASGLFLLSVTGKRYYILDCSCLLVLLT
jgi:hypothetical protein